MMKKEGFHFLDLKGRKFVKAFLGRIYGKQEVWLPHHRHGQLTFQSLKNLYPDLCFTLDMYKFKCESCELLKIHLVTFFSK